MTAFRRQLPAIALPVFSTGSSVGDWRRAENTESERR